MQVIAVIFSTSPKRDLFDSYNRNGLKRIECPGKWTTFVIPKVVPLRKTWSAEQGARAVMKVCGTAMPSTFIQMKAVTFFLSFFVLSLFTTFSFLLGAVLPYNMSAGRQRKSTVAGMLHRPLKRIFLHFLFRQLCVCPFETGFLFRFTLTDIFLQRPHDSFRVAWWNS